MAYIALITLIAIVAVPTFVNCKKLKRVKVGFVTVEFYESKRRRFNFRKD